jgi:predicted HTH domain antitoxin
LNLTSPIITEVLALGSSPTSKKHKTGTEPPRVWAGRTAHNDDRTMSITLQVPDSVARGLRLPEGEAVERLRSELALSLYTQDILSFGKAAELAAVSRHQFAGLVARRGIPRHYGPEDLAEDLAYGRGE